MPQRKSLAELLNTNGEFPATDLYKALFPLMESEESGATKGCDCPACQQVRASYGQNNVPKEPDAKGGLVQAIASLVVNGEIVSVGFTVPEAEDVQQRVAVRFSQDSNTEILTADQARILGHALLAAASHID